MTAQQWITVFVIIGLWYAFSLSSARTKNLERQRSRKKKNHKTHPMKTMYLNSLSSAEARAIEELRQINHDSLWGEAIAQTLNTDSPSEFRVLVAQLQSQNRDNPDVMKKILGPAYDSVMAL